MSKTISITIPDQLEIDLQKSADKIGISRSRFIGNILLKWQEKTNMVLTSDCDHRNSIGECLFFGQTCNVPQIEAITCSGYLKKE